MLKKCKTLILLVLALLFVSGSYNESWASVASSDVEESDSVRVYFKQGIYKLELDFENNEKNLESFIARMHRLYTERRFAIKSIRIVGGASPEGNSKFNRLLSDKRAEAITSYLRSYMALPDSLIQVISPGVDWEGLERLVEASDLEYRDEILNIVRNTPEWIVKDGKVVDGRKRQLMMLKGGKAWWEMYDKLFPTLRSSALQVIVDLERLPQEAVLGSEELVLPVRVGMPPIKRQKAAEPEVVEEPADECTPFYMDIRTNMLYDVALVPNIGVEFYLGRRWSIAGNWMYSWWHSDKRHNYWRTYGGDLEVRKWFGPRSKEKPLTGHHLGVYGQIVTYDFELGSRGYLGDRWTYGAGLAYGYSVPVGRRFNIDFTVGVGYLGGEYKEYLPIDDCYVWQVTKQRRWFGPTKAEIQLIWLIGCGNYNKMKGGK